MAKKPKKVESKRSSVKDEDDFNSGLDNIQDDIGSDFNMDFDSDMESLDKPSKLSLGKDFVKSGVSDFVDTALKKSSEKLLPDEYRYAYSELSDTFDSVKYEISTGMDELKKSSIPTLRLVNKILPKRIKFLDNMIERYSGGSEKSKQQQNEEAISSALTVIF
jgi:hypothetical protein